MEDPERGDKPPNSETPGPGKPRSLGKKRRRRRRKKSGDNCGLLRNSAAISGTDASDAKHVKMPASNGLPQGSGLNATSPRNNNRQAEPFSNSADGLVAHEAADFGNQKKSRRRRRRRGKNDSNAVAQELTQPNAENHPLNHRHRRQPIQKEIPAAYKNKSNEDAHRSENLSKHSKFNWRNRPKQTKQGQNYQSQRTFYAAS